MLLWRRRTAGLRVRWDATLVRNMVAVYGALLYGNALTLLTVMYLARVLGPSAWGPVILAQAVAWWVGMVQGYGFGLAGTRAVAQARDDPHALSRLVAGIIGSQLCLIILTAAVIPLVPWLIPAFHGKIGDVVAAWCLSIGTSLTPSWYFQGLERMAPVSYATLAATTLSLALVVLLVHGPGSAALVIWIQALATAGAAAWLWRCLYREVPGRVPDRADIRGALRMAQGMFAYRVSTGLYTSANTLVIGLFMSPAAVSFFGGAEKLSKTAVRLIGPITTVLLPRISHLVGQDRARARRLAVLSLVVSVAIGVLFGGAICLLAPEVVHLVLGARYGPAIPLIRVLSLLVVIVPIGSVLGLQWMVPLGLDGSLTRIVLCAGVCNVILAVALVPRFGTMGMALAVVASEAIVVTSMWVVLERKGLGLGPRGRMAGRAA